MEVNFYIKLRSYFYNNLYNLELLWLVKEPIFNYNISVLFLPSNITVGIDSLTVVNSWVSLSSVLTPNFTNQHFLIDFITKLSYLDTVILASSTWQFYDVKFIKSLYTALNYDIILKGNVHNLPLFFQLNFEYTDRVSDVLLLTPELSFGLIDYTLTYTSPSYFDVNVSSIFDSYISVWTPLSIYSADSASIFLFLLLTLSIVIELLSVLLLSVRNVVNFQFLRTYYYIFSISREIRIQFEVVLQTIAFFIFYWIGILMTFDDNQEEVIEFVNVNFFYFFTLLIIYLCFKYSIHYFSFLEASVTEGRSVSFLTKQVFKDFLNTLSLILRFYILLLRVNVYDTLDDFLDSYYIFIGDFDEDEYLVELALSIHNTLMFLSENDYDTSYQFEDEHESVDDWLYVYYVVWGKLFYFMFFLLEEAARLGLAFYVCYLIIFEVHSVNCSYYEDTYMTSKR